LDQIRSLPIEYEGNPVGYLDIRSPMPIPEPARDRFIQRMQLNLLIVGSAAILLSLGLGFFFSRFITKPIRELTIAAQEVSNGNLNQRVQIHSRDEIGQLSIVFNVMTDKLDKLIKSQKQMTADIAHELRTPISVILGHAEGIHDGVIPSTPETMEIIREESIRLEHLVNDLRMLALSDSGELELKQMSHPPKSIIDQTYDHFHYQVQARGISLNKMIADKLPEILVDMDRMTQVFSNLLENAIRNTPSGGEITLRAVQFNDVVELSVEDTGYGIEKEDLEKIFDRLYRTDQSRKKDKGGTGLGLALARMIVEQHGGTIHAESEPGKGTRMVIRLQVVIRNGN
jgi:signal transduction histidine kinase